MALAICIFTDKHAIHQHSNSCQYPSNYHTLPLPRRKYPQIELRHYLRSDWNHRVFQWTDSSRTLDEQLVGYHVCNIKRHSGYTCLSGTTL